MQELRTLRQVANRVYVARARLWRTTTTVVLDADRALVVDPAITVVEVESLAATIRRRGWRVEAGFSTHPHWDHLLWSPAFGDRPRFATAAGVRQAATRAEHARVESAQLAPGHDPGDLTGTTALAEGCDLLPWPAAGDAIGVVEHRAHVPGHAALVVDDVLIAGDMLSDVEVPLLGEEPGRMAEYRAGLDALEHAVRSSGVRVVIPGHGAPAVGSAAIHARFAADRAYLDALDLRAVRDPSPEDARIDPRLVAAPLGTADAGTAGASEAGYVARWHAEQLAGLRAER